jgi:hypothetical protein
MKCPHCGHDKSRVIESRARPEADLRIRICQGCGKDFRTLERVALYAGRSAGYVELAQPPALEVVPTPPVDLPKVKVAKAARFEAQLGGDLLGQVCLEAQPLLVQWWNESRWSKHKAKATWTEAAWLSSVNRVARLPRELQLQLANAGVEHGWQALKPEFLDRSDLAAAAGARPTPTDPAMLEALASW